jgi:hypothetical protein
MAKPNRVKPIPVELTAKLQDIADKEKTTILSFVAPHGVRTSPVTFATASIVEDEIYRLEKIVDEALKLKATKNLHLVIHTPGGEMHASYKIASFLRSKFDNISGFIPYEAASGGTIFCCAANQIYISDLGNITSFDPQVRYKDTRVSAYAFVRAVDSIEEEYGEMSPAEIPSPWQQMAQKLDPVIYDEMNTVLFTSTVFGARLLIKSGYKEDKAYRIASRLTRNNYTHGMPIFATEAKEIGFEVREDNKEVMRLYQELVSNRLEQSSTKHLIDVIYPSQKSGDQKITKKIA